MQSIANSVSTLQAAKVLRLPEEIMQNIGKHFTLAEWVQGPAQTCHRRYTTPASFPEWT